MKVEKANYLGVTYQPKKGLVFRWNFRDLWQQAPFFHHLFVLRNTSPAFLHQFLSQYYKKMKFGDLFRVLYYDQAKQAIGKSNWLQKTQLQNYDFSKIVQKTATDQLSSQVKEAMTKAAINQTLQGNQNFVVNFILQQQASRQGGEWLRLVENSRKQGGFGYICSFFGRFKATDISFATGVNCLNIRPDQIQSIVSFYYSHLNNAVIKRAEISLECTTGQLISNDPINWRSIDFNKLQKDFYGPSAAYECDQLYFLKTECTPQKSSEVEIIIRLSITLFSCQQLLSSKRVRLSLSKEKHCELSLHLVKPGHFVNSLGTWMTCYPFSTLTVVRVT